jgi:hypothetical protein
MSLLFRSKCAMAVMFEELIGTQADGLEETESIP